jgi:phosphoribosyl 1,2-cyclic phosphodiesterase
MTLTFLGTRGYIDARTRRHRMHSALLLAHRGARVMLDCGEDWHGRLGRLRLDAVVVTHAHPDHAGGLRQGSPCPVFATAETWRGMARFAIARGDRRVIAPRRGRRIAGIGFEAFPVIHSIRAPAVGYRISAGGVRLFYVPDVLRIPDRAAALRGAALYIGDGASIVRPIVRGRGRTRFGHAPVRAQLAWCRAEGLRHALFTHCGSRVVAGGARSEATIRLLGRACGVEAAVAHDGMVVTADPPARRAPAKPRAPFSRDCDARPWGVRDGGGTRLADERNA